MTARRFWRVTGRAWLALSVVLVGWSSPSWANLPFAGQHYPNGAEDFVVGALPPPGVYLKTYMAYFQKDRLMGDEGEKLPLDLDVSMPVVVPRLIWVTPWKLFGASVATQAFFPMYSADVESDALGIDSSSSGLGDIIFTPIALGWHFGPNFHVILAEDMFIPTGNYDKKEPASQILSKNHWTFESVLAVNYLWKGFDFSAKFMYDINTKNDEYVLGTPGGPVEGTLKPGQEFHVDWAVSYARSEGLRFGLSGYSYWQVSEDNFDGGGLDIDGDKGEAHAIGPTIKYWPNMGRFSVVVKHQWEFGAKNLPEGQTTWVNVVWVF